MQIDKEFKESILNTVSIKEQVIDVFEALIDSQIESEFIKSIPVLGWAVKAVGAVDKIKTNFLVNKILLFLKGISNLSEDELTQFENRFLSNQNNVDKFYQALLISIDRLDHLDKSTIVSALFKSLIHNKINEAYFLRSVNIIQNIYIEDLKEYLTGRLTFTSSEIYEKANVTQIYLSFGLLNSHIVQQENATQRVHQEAELRFHYMYSSFGQKFIKACNFEL
jgi:hypothetical protein